jgi:hypothetical protein
MRLYKILHFLLLSGRELSIRILKHIPIFAPLVNSARVVPVPVPAPDPLDLEGELAVDQLSVVESIGLIAFGGWTG